MSFESEVRNEVETDPDNMRSLPQVELTDANTVEEGETDGRKTFNSDEEMYE